MRGPPPPPTDRPTDHPYAATVVVVISLIIDTSGRARQRIDPPTPPTTPCVLISHTHTYIVKPYNARITCPTGFRSVVCVCVCDMFTSCPTSDRKRDSHIDTQPPTARSAPSRQAPRGRRRGPRMSDSSVRIIIVIFFFRIIIRKPVYNIIELPFWE